MNEKLGAMVQFQSWVRKETKTKDRIRKNTMLSVLAETMVDDNIVRLNDALVRMIGISQDKLSVVTFSKTRNDTTYEKIEHDALVDAWDEFTKIWLEFENKGENMKLVIYCKKCGKFEGFELVKKTQKCSVCGETVGSKKLVDLLRAVDKK